MSTSSNMGGFKDSDVVVASFARTPIGKMGGALAGFSAPQV
jgi:acetyl-CoA acetyltransferase